MKKIFTLLTGALTCVCLSFGFTACGDSASGNGKDVTLVEISAASVGTMSDFDYYVVAEPMATTRATAANLNFVGDLQQLYGSQNGYPQAVIVAKNSLIENNSAFINDFLTAVEENEDWLTAETTEISQIVSAITAHLPENTGSSLSADNLTADVIANCGIRFVSAQEDKTRVQNYIAAVGEIDGSMVGTMTDGFFYAPAAETTTASSTVSVYMPDGAPALALAQLMAEDMQFGNSVSYHVVPSTDITTHVNGDSPAADICILPSNAASKLLGSNAKYTMLGTVTNGNLYILSKNGEQITADNVASVLAGKKVGVVQLSNVPGLTFKLILKKYGLSYSDPSEL